MTIAILVGVIVLLVWGHWKLTSVHIREMEVRLNEIEIETKKFIESMSDTELVTYLNERKRARGLGHNGDEGGPEGSI